MYASCISSPLFILVLCTIRMGTDGLPMGRRERGVHQDIISGNDFLSVLMESPALIQAYKELSTTEMPSVTRLSRSTQFVDHYDFSQIPEDPEQKPSDNPLKFNATEQFVQTPSYAIEVTTSGHHELLEADSGLITDTDKSDFHLGETQPTLPNYLNENHQSVIYHSNPSYSNSARSVSYSTVIQSLPKQRSPLTWNDENQPQHHGERRERHYDIHHHNSNENILEKVEDKFKNKLSSSWEKPEQSYASTERNWEIPEKNHGLREKPYTTAASRHFPIIYGKPEENYEVDEAVSVMSSGRVHGVQPPPAAKNDNQKVGYVVEGRNYRKYRVEERTSDGFIVGEYGVVSHDDGSLRGVRYTADGNINPRIVYDALMKFLSL